MSFWTEERVVQLKAMHHRGCSSSEIGRALKTTRNAVIGKLHRMGIRRAIPNITAQLEGKAAIVGLKAKGEKVIKLPRFPMDKRHVSRPVPQVCEPVSLLDLRPCHCRFPVSGEGADTLFCGAPKQQGAYCKPHYYNTHFSDTPPLNTGSIIYLDGRDYVKPSAAERPVPLFKFMGAA